MRAPLARGTRSAAIKSPRGEASLSTRAPAVISSGGEGHVTRVQEPPNETVSEDLITTSVAFVSRASRQSRSSAVASRSSPRRGALDQRRRSSETSACMGVPALRLFISYSHKDGKLKDQLLEHLDVVRRFEGVDIWTDELIEPGANWRVEIERNLANADVAILLVSPSFLASRFIQDTAIPDILARNTSQGLLVVPVILRDCAWKEHPVIERFQVLPRNGEPITRHNGNRRDRAFMEVATEIAKLGRKRNGLSIENGRTASTTSAGTLQATSNPMALGGSAIVSGRIGARTNITTDHREEYLVGRDLPITEVRQALHKQTGWGVVLFGMTGIGKTSIAQIIASVAQRETAFPGGVFWLSGDSHEEFMRGLANVGAVFHREEAKQGKGAAGVGVAPDVGEALDQGLPGEKAAEDIGIARARLELCNAKEPTLLVIDQLNPGAGWVQTELEPFSRTMRVLATTTHAPTGFLHGPGKAQWIHIDALDREDAHAWVQSVAPRLPSTEVDMLLSFFERHTLALDVAARTLHDDAMLTVSRYLDSLQRGRDWTEAPEVTGAGLTALQALRFLSERALPSARKAWALAGCFASAPIPVGWLRSALAVAGLSDVEAHQGVKELVRRHLGVRVGDGSAMTLPLHPLVHIVARTLASDADRSAMAQGVVQWIPGLDDPELHVKVPVAWPHIEAAWGGSAADPLVALRLAALLKHRGHRGDLVRARDMLANTIEVAEQIEGPHSEAVAAVCNALGCILMEFGNRTSLEEAERMLRRALTSEEKPLGRDSAAVAVRLSNLAMVLKTLGGLSRFEGAEILLRRALDTDERALGVEAPPVAVRLGNLAMVLKSLGGRERLEEAERLLRRAIRIQKRALGEHAPTLAVTLSNLAMVLGDLGEQGRMNEAEELLRRALAIRESTLGLDTPRVAVTLHNLAMVLQTLGGNEQLMEAEELLRRALIIEEHALGVNAPKVAVTLCNLASVLKSLGGVARLTDAIELLERAVEVSMLHLGPLHNQTKLIRRSIDICQRALKKLEDRL